MIWPSIWIILFWFQNVGLPNLFKQILTQQQQQFIFSTDEGVLQKLVFLQSRNVKEYHLSCNSYCRRNSSPVHTYVHYN